MQQSPVGPDRFLRAPQVEERKIANARILGSAIEQADGDAHV
jgi:hypothetical protein